MALLHNVMMLSIELERFLYGASFSLGFSLYCLLFFVTWNRVGNTIHCNLHFIKLHT